MKYTIIIYLFDVLDANFFLYKFGQTQTTLTLVQSKMPYIQDGGSISTYTYAKFFKTWLKFSSLALMFG